MMGFDFATHVNAYLKENGYETRNIAKIDSNPAKSKHLETATTRLFGLDVDFANLRTEVYSQDSRIPSHIVRYTRHPKKEKEKEKSPCDATFSMTHTAIGLWLAYGGRLPPGYHD